MRSLVDNPERRRRLTEQFDAALSGADALDAVASFVKIFEHAYGRPPQALDIRTAEVKPGDQVIYRAVVQDLGAPEAEELSGADVSLGSTD